MNSRQALTTSSSWVDPKEDLNEWEAKLNRLGIAHSGVKAPGYTGNAMLTFRDLDNIQIEFFWEGSYKVGVPTYMANRDTRISQVGHMVSCPAKLVQVGRGHPS